MSLRLDRPSESTATSEEAGEFAGKVSLFSVPSTTEKVQQDTIPESADTKRHLEHSHMDSESVIVDITAAVNKLKSRQQWDPAKPGYLHFSRRPDVDGKPTRAILDGSVKFKGFRVEEISVEE